MDSNSNVIAITADQEAELLNLEAPFNTVLEAAPSIKGAMKMYGVGSKDLWMADPKVLRVIEGFNPRVNTAKHRANIRKYANSMKAIGWIANSVLKGYTAVENGEVVIYITAVHSRLKAVALANSEGADIFEVPIIVKTKGVSMDDLDNELIAENEASPLTAYEKGVVILRKVRANHSLEDISRDTGVDLPWMGKLLKLMAAPNRLKQLVAFDYISATLAIDTIEEHGPKALEMLEQTLALKNGSAVVVTEDGPGKDHKRVTQKDLNAASPEKRQFKVFKKYAPTMHNALTKVTSDPGYAGLSAATRQQLDGLMAEVQKAGAEANGYEDVVVETEPGEEKLFDAGTATTSNLLA